MTDRLQQQWERDRREIEQTGAAKRRRLGESWSSAASSARRSIEADMAARTGRTRAVLTRVRRLTAATGLSLLAAICDAGSGTMRWWSMRIENRPWILPVLNVDIEQDRQTLARLRTTVWPVEPREIDGKRFVVLPAGSMEHPPSAVDGRSAVKRSSE